MLGGRELSDRRVEPSSAHSPDTKPLPGLGTAHHPPPKAPAPSNALASFLFLHHAGRPRLAIGWHRSGTKAKAQPEPLDSSRTHRPGAPPALQGRDRTNGLRDQNPPQVQFNAGWQTEARPCAPRGSAPRGPESPASNTQFRPPPTHPPAPAPSRLSRTACLSPGFAQVTRPVPPQPRLRAGPLPHCLHTPPTGPLPPPSEPCRCGPLLAHCLPLPLTGQLRPCGVRRPGTGPTRAEAQLRFVE